MHLGTKSFVCALWGKLGFIATCPHWHTPSVIVADKRVCASPSAIPFDMLAKLPTAQAETMTSVD